MGPPGIVEVDPRADDPFGLEAIRQLVEIDRLSIGTETGPPIGVQ
jgi:hypothetical protein